MKGYTTVELPCKFDVSGQNLAMSIARNISGAGDPSKVTITGGGSKILADGYTIPMARRVGQKELHAVIAKHFNVERGSVQYKCRNHYVWVPEGSSHLEFSVAIANRSRRKNNRCITVATLFVWN